MNLDYTISSFLNSFVGRSPALDEILARLMGRNSMLSGAMYLSAVWFLVVQELRRPKSRATPDRGGDSGSRSAPEQRRSNSACRFTLAHCTILRLT